MLSILLSKALRLQQEIEDRKNDFIITELENKLERLVGLLTEKEVIMQSTEAGLAEVLKLNEDKDEKIAEKDKEIQWLRNEVN
jgi:hypothetical protein